jgi:phosphatidylserine/phosphatidylglycerophosphate/cardiolipin synthase-like enzyme
MNTSHRLRRRKKAPLRFLLKVSSLQSALAILLAFLLYTAATEYLFTPSITEVKEEEGACLFLSTDLKDPIRSSLEHSIRNAKESVLFIIYSLSDKKVISALRDVSLRGVDVMVVHDPVETQDCSFLLGKKVKCFSRRGQGLMHNKLLVVDHSIVWLGSANMSTQSLTQQGNFIIALHCHAIAKAIETLATSMISQSPYPSSPLHVKFHDSTLSLFFHPFHGSLAFQSLINRINAASKRIFVAMFTFTHPDLVSALCRAKERGVDVRVILDKDSSTQTSKKSYLKLKREGIPCGYRTKTGLLHYKTAVIDTTLVAGSCNWTKAGFTSNHEAMLFIETLSPSQQIWIDRWWNQVEQCSSLRS